MEIVDVLEPPTFKKSGRTKPLKRAWAKQDWIGTFNLWVIQNKPQPAVVYQVRSPKSNWAPGKLDVTTGGHYSSGESLFDGLREVEEELGKKYPKKELTYLGRKINLSPDTQGHLRHNVVDVSFILDNSPLESFRLQASEVYALCLCPIDQLLKVHTKKNYHFWVEALTYEGKKIKIKVDRKSFPYNWDNYHFKIAHLAQKFLNGEKHLIY